MPGNEAEAARPGEPKMPTETQRATAAAITDADADARAGFADEVLVNEMEPPQGHILEAKLGDKPPAYPLQTAVGTPKTRTRRRLGTSNYAATRKQVSLAKRWVRAMFDGVVDDDALYDLALCTVELVDNGRKHGRPDGVITVTAYITEDTAQLEVTNDRNGKTVPHIQNNLETTHGHGLKIVSTLAKHWGSHLTDDLDQVVWCEFPRIIEKPDAP